MELSTSWRDGFQSSPPESKSNTKRGRSKTRELAPACNPDGFPFSTSILTLTIRSFDSYRELQRYEPLVYVRAVSKIN